MSVGKYERGHSSKRMSVITGLLPNCRRPLTGYRGTNVRPPPPSITSGPKYASDLQASGEVWLGPLCFYWAIKFLVRLYSPLVFQSPGLNAFITHLQPAAMKSYMANSKSRAARPPQPEPLWPTFLEGGGRPLQRQLKGDATVT